MNQLKVNAPADFIVRRISRVKALASPRYLPPSRHAFYIDAMKSYCNAYHFAEDVLVINPSDGSGIFKHECLVYLTKRAKRKSFTFKYTFDGEVISTDLSAIALAVPECGETVTPQYHATMKSIFKTWSPRDSHVNLFTERVLSADRKQLIWTVKSPDFFPMRLLVGDDEKASAAIVCVRLEAELGPNSFKCLSGSSTKTMSDKWERIMALPCGEYTIKIVLPNTSEFEVAELDESVRFWEETHVSETERLKQEIEANQAIREPNTIEKTVRFPLTGATYRFEWQIWSHASMCNIQAQQPPPPPPTSMDSVEKTVH